METAHGAVAGRKWSRVAWTVALAAVGLAVVALVASLVISRPDPDALWAEAQAAFSAGEHDRTRDILDQIARLRPATPLDNLLRAQVLMAGGRIDPALELLAAVPDDHPGAPQARLQAGQLELRRFRARAAEDWFRKAITLDPKLVQPRRELLYILGMQLRRAELGEQFRALSTLGTLTFNDAFLWCLTRGSVWEPYEQAQTLQAFVDADEADRQSRLALAETRRRTLEFDRAEAALTPLGDSDADALAVRIRIALDRGDTDAVDTLLARGHESHPELARIRARLAQARGDLPGAIAAYRAVLATDPDDRDALFGLGQALQLKGDPEASAYLERARTFDRLATLIQKAAPGNARARDDMDLVRALGLACEAAGRIPEARAWYGVAIARDPLDAAAQQALFRLGAGRPAPSAR